MMDQTATTAAESDLPADDAEERLRELLFGSEIGDIDRLNAIVEDVVARVGDNSALKSTLVPMLADMLRTAGARDHEGLANALAPLVLESLRQEIRNSKDMLVDALYPITGRLVSAAVRNAIKQQMESLDRSLNAAMSPERVRVWAQSKLTGESQAAIWMRRHPPFMIHEAFLVHRTTGLLAARATLSESVSPVDADILGAMLTAVQSFVADTFSKDESSDLRTLAFGDADLFLRSSPTLVLAVRATGVPPKDIDARLDPVFADLISTWNSELESFDGEIQDDIRESIEADMESRLLEMSTLAATPSKSSPWKAYAVVGAIVLVLLSWWGYSEFQASQRAATLTAVQDAIRDTDGVTGYPVQVNWSPSGEEIDVYGLARDPGAVAAAVKASQAVQSDFPINGSVISLPPPPVFEMPEIEFPKIEIPKIEIPQPTAEELLQEVVAKTTVFMTPDGSLRFEEESAAKLLELASLLSLSNPEMRIALVGHVAPGSGNLASLRRSVRYAEVVAKQLTDRGINRDRLVISALGDLSPFTAHPAAAADNNRVTVRMAETSETGVPEIEIVKGKLREAMADAIVFFTRGDTLGDELAARAAIAQVVEAWLAVPESQTILVAGYTDATGSAALNAVLAEQRAAVAASLLLEAGIPNENVVREARASAEVRYPTEEQIDRRRAEFTLADDELTAAGGSRR